MPPANDADIRDIIEPTALVDPLLVAIVVAIALAALILGILLLLLILKRKKTTPPPVPRSPRSDAMAELEKIRKNLPELSAHESSTQIEDALKTYLYHAYQEPAHYATTQELFGDRRPDTRPPATPETLRFHHCFDLCDAIRFGRTDGVTPAQAMDAAFTALAAETKPQPKPAAADAAV